MEDEEKQSQQAEEVSTEQAGQQENETPPETSLGTWGLIALVLVSLVPSLGSVHCLLASCLLVFAVASVASKDRGDKTTGVAALIIFAVFGAMAACSILSGF